ncbi:MAG: nucleotidyl transferase AbiEii/AbiGii toxin family protein [Candidatus Competibacter sp.]|nr:nucleotidyl transferase AbiEii/AbiGii toxin family protein [Candidatus Competibacter sp.]MDG4583664.1 nucleotidyl transferase AbiEii/AbiGii toxin family protein [Candidatus Competibacter sp.]
MDLLVELARIIKAFEEDKMDYALCGGLALAVYAKPRATLDIDIMVQSDFLDKIKKKAEKLGFTVHAAPMKFKGGAVQIHRMTKFDDELGEHLSLDLLIVTPETKLSWDSRITVEWEGGTLKVISPRGLIQLKSLRNSGQDRDDIKYLSGLLDED